MFDLGFSKLLVILAVALIVLGPEKLPTVAAQVGRWLGRARTMARQFRDQLEEEASTLQNATRVDLNANRPASPPPASAPAADSASPVTAAAPADQSAHGAAAAVPAASEYVSPDPSAWTQHNDPPTGPTSGPTAGQS